MITYRKSGARKIVRNLGMMKEPTNFPGLYTPTISTSDIGSQGMVPVPWTPDQIGAQGPSADWSPYAPPPPTTCTIASVQVANCPTPDNLDNPMCDPSKIVGLDAYGQQRADAAINDAVNKYTSQYPWWRSIPDQNLSPQYFDYTGRFPLGSKGPQLPVTRYVLYPNNKVPPEFFDPAHPPLPSGSAAAKAFEAGMYLFFPQGFFDFGGKTPGHLRSGLIDGSTVYGMPYAWWYPMVSDEMVNFAVDFIKGGGFGPESQIAQKSFEQAGLEIAKSGFNLAKAIAVPAKGFTAGQYKLSGDRMVDTGISLAAGIAGAALAAQGFPGVGTAIGAGLALFSAFADLFADDPDPPAWVKKLSKMVDIARDTGGFYWVGANPFGAGDLPAYTPIACTRFWPMKQAKYNVIEGYVEVMRRVAGKPSSGNPTGADFPWSIALVAAAMGGFLILALRE